jgi:hypothetical protein
MTQTMYTHMNKWITKKKEDVWNKKKNQCLIQVS